MSFRPRFFKNTLPDYSNFAENLSFDFVPGLIDNYVEQIEDKFKPIPQNADGGLYVGAAGVAFMYLKLSGSKYFHGKRTQLLEKALIYVKVVC